jgi:hydroxypyruvate isomerase
MRFAAHLEMNFPKEVSFADRWTVAAQAGFTGCEFVWRTRELSEVRKLRARTPLAVTCLGGTLGFAPGGGRPILTLPEEREWLVREMLAAIDYAQKAGCPNLVVVPGNLNPGWSFERHRDEAVRSLSEVAPYLEAAGITALLEPLNSKTDHKGTYCDTAAEGFRIVERVGSPNVKILFDIYHAQIMETRLIETIRGFHSLIGYYHVARFPGRFEPLGGEFELRPVLDAIAGTGYDGYVGLEFRPSGTTEEAYSRLHRAYPSFF